MDPSQYQTVSNAHQPMYSPYIPLDKPPISVKHFHSDDSAIKKIEVKEGFLARIGNAIASLFSKKVDEKKVQLAFKNAKVLEEHKASVPAQERLKDHTIILQELKEAHHFTHNHWRIDLKIAQEYYAEGEFKEALEFLNKIPTANYTRELFYFRAVVLKENGDFKEAHRLYELLLAGKGPPQNVKKQALIQELKELVEKWNEKSDKTVDEVQILADYYPKADLTPEMGAAPKTAIVSDLPEYFVMERIPSAKFDPNSASFKYLKDNINKSDNVKTIQLCHKLSSASEKWKWTLRLAKEYDLLARMPDNDEQKAQEYHQKALDTFPMLEKELSSKLPPELLHVKANLLWKVGKLTEALKLFERIMSKGKVLPSIQRSIRLELSQLTLEINELEIINQQKAEKNCIDHLNSGKSIQDLRKLMDPRIIPDFFKKNGHLINVLNLESGYFFLYNGSITKHQLFEACPNLKHLEATHYFSDKGILEDPPLFSKLKSLSIKGIKSFNFVKDTRILNTLESLTLYDEFADPSQIPLKFPSLKSLNLSGTKMTDEGFANLMKNFKAPSDLESLNLSNCLLSGRQLEILNDNLWKFTNLKTLDLHGKLQDEENIRIKPWLITGNPILSSSKLEMLSLPQGAQGHNNNIVYPNFPNPFNLKELQMSCLGLYTTIPLYTQYRLVRLTFKADEKERLEKFLLSIVKMLNLEYLNIDNTESYTTHEEIVEEVQKNLHKFPKLKTFLIDNQNYDYVIDDYKKKREIALESERAESEINGKIEKDLEKEKLVVESLNVTSVKDILQKENLTLTQLRAIVQRHSTFIHSLNFDGFAQHYAMPLVDKMEIYKLIETCPKIHQISVNHSIDVAEIVSELMAEGKLNQLETLDLSNNKINDDEVIILSKHLDKLPKLTTLILSHNEIGDQGIQALAQAVQSLANFKSLNIVHNHFGEAGRRALLANSEDELSGEPSEAEDDLEPGSALAEGFSLDLKEPSAPEPETQSEPQIEGLTAYKAKTQITEPNPVKKTAELLEIEAEKQVEDEAKS